MKQNGGNVGLRQYQVEITIVLFNESHVFVQIRQVAGNPGAGKLIRDDGDSSSHKLAQDYLGKPWRSWSNDGRATTNKAAP